MCYPFPLPCLTIEFTSSYVISINFHSSFCLFQLSCFHGVFYIRMTLIMTKNCQTKFNKQHCGPFPPRLPWQLSLHLPVWRHSTSPLALASLVVVLSRSILFSLRLLFAEPGPHTYKYAQLWIYITNTLYHHCINSVSLQTTNIFSLNVNILY